MTLADALAELRLGARAMNLRDLQALAAALRPLAGELEPYIHFADHRYTRNVISRTADFEALLLCWRAGQRSRVHDHGRSICAMSMVEGILNAENYRRSPAGLIYKDYSEDFTPGAVLTIQTTEIHRVSNLQDDDVVSLHLYLPPLQNNAMWDTPQVTRRLPRVA